jgi:hypothetical protein
MVELAFKLSVQDDLNITKDDQIAALKKQIDQTMDLSEKRTKNL